MDYVPFVLIALACPIGMGLMMLFMGKGMMGMGHRSETEANPARPGGDLEKELAVLQAQRELIDGRITAREAEFRKDPRPTTELPR